MYFKEKYLRQQLKRYIKSMLFVCYHRNQYLDVNIFRLTKWWMFSSNTFASFCYPKSCYAQNVYNYRIPFQHVFSFMASCICLSSLFYSLTHSLCLLPFISHSLIVCSFYGNINKIFHSWFLNFYYFNVQKLYHKSISCSKLELSIYSNSSSCFKITKTILNNK